MSYLWIYYHFKFLVKSIGFHLIEFYTQDIATKSSLLLILLSIIALLQENVCRYTNNFNIQLLGDILFFIVFLDFQFYIVFIL